MLLRISYVFNYKAIYSFEPETLNFSKHKYWFFLALKYKGNQISVGKI